MSIINLNAKQLAEAIKRTVSAGLVPQIEGSPGIGKSDIVRQIAADWKLKVIDLRLSQAAPEDLNGLPMRKDNKAAFLPFENFPIEGDEIPEGYNGWLLFLDEITSAPKSVQAAAYKLILDRQVGIHNLHPSVAMVAAGNKMTDRAVVIPQSTALQSRLVHLSLEVDTDAWIEWALSNNIDYRIIAYISYKKGDLYQFNPKHQDKTFACPRTWEFVNRLIKDRKDLDIIDSATISGSITEGIAVPFISFTDIGKNIPTIKDILDKPESTVVPKESSQRYFVTISLMDHTTNDNFSEVVKYIKRFPQEFQVIFIRGITKRNIKLRMHQEYQKIALEILRFANSEDEEYAPITQ